MDCSAFQRRLADVNWVHTNLVTPPTPPEPDLGGAAELLDEAEDIVNAAGERALSEVKADRVPWWRRWRRSGR